MTSGPVTRDAPDVFRAVASQGGLSLIEMLIALLVLSFGLLGVAGLQAVSLKNNQSAYLRTQASFWAYEVIDRMRANRENALNGAYDMGDPEDPDAGDSIPTADARATEDLTTWRAALADLPSGLGAVDCDAGICRVGVEWDDTRGAAPAAPARILLSTGL
jgi:type IV pilus assembly protein PilV